MLLLGADMAATVRHQTPLIETVRLLLRPVTLEDAPAIQRYFANWEIIRHLSTAVPWPYPGDGALCYIRDVLLPGMEKGALMTWSINLKEAPNETIGLLEYRIGQEPNAEGLIDHRGFWMAREHQGKGLMTEAVTAFQDYIFFELGVDRITVHNAATNPASRKIKTKTGAVFVGIVEMDHHEGGKETEQWEITREGWTAFRERDTH
jgi:[ribosomal protein S5]-alanine N-acetyltransferase